MRKKQFSKKWKGCMWCCIVLAVMLLPVYCMNVMAENTGKKETTDIVDINQSYVSVLYNNLNGLPTSEANAIVQTEDGFIWIGSYSGLIRYDGKEFYRFPPSTGISNVNVMIADSRQRLWIGTNDRGIASMYNGEFTFYTEKDVLGSLSVRAFTEDQDGVIYYGTTSGVGYITTSGEAVRISDERIDSQYITSLCSNGGSEVIGTTKNGDIFRIVDQKIVNYYKDGQVTSTTPLRVCKAVKEGFYYIGETAQEIAYISFQEYARSGSDSVKRYQTGNLQGINDIKDFGESGIYVCSDNGIGYFDDKDDFYIVNGLSMDNSIENIMSDLEGNLWFTSSRQGVMKLTRNIFDDLFERADLEKQVVNTTCLDGDMLYIGTDKSLIILENETSPVRNALTEMMAGVRIREIIRDSKGNIWIASYGKYALSNIIRKLEKLSVLRLPRECHQIESGRWQNCVMGIY